MTTLKDQLDKVTSNIRGLQDELKVRAHLMQMDAKQEWEKLQPRLLEVQQFAGAVSDGVLTTRNDLVRDLAALRDRVLTLAQQHAVRPG